MTMIVKHSGILLLLSLTFLKIPSISAVQQVNETLSNNERGNTNKIDGEERGNKIIGGYRCPITRYPFLVSLREQKYSTFRHYCGGTLLSKFWVLTAFHCLRDNCVKPIEVVAGSNFIKHSHNETVQSSTVLRCYLYPILDARQYDIALAKLKKPIVETNNVGYAKLPFSLYSISGPVRDSCTNSTVAGWGSQFAKNSSQFPIVLPVPERDSHLRCVHLPIISSEVCQIRVRVKVTPSILCTYHPMRDVCSGDSGGPLMCDGYQYGIVSFGYGCGFGGFAAVYANITYFRKFIVNTLKSKYLTPRAKSTANIIRAIKLSAVLVTFVISQLYLPV